MVEKVEPVQRKTTVKFLSVILLTFCFASGFSQNEDRYVREGNQLYKKGKYSPADSLYRRSLENNAKSFKGEFNLGDALYKQGKFAEAADHFQNLASRKTGSDTLSRLWHNIGNCQLRQSKFEESVSSYKRSLKLNPDDEETRYNLAYAQKMLQQKKKDEDKKNKNQDKNDNKDKEQNKDKKKNSDNKDKQKKPQEQPQLSKEDMQRLLNAMANEEKQLQQKMQKKKAKSTQKKIDKDW